MSAQLQGIVPGSRRQGPQSGGRRAAAAAPGGVVVGSELDEEVDGLLQ
jgi:hypothetical protein